MQTVMQWLKHLSWHMFCCYNGVPETGKRKRSLLTNGSGSPSTQPSIWGSPHDGKTSGHFGETEERIELEELTYTPRKASTYLSSWPKLFLSNTSSVRTKQREAQPCPCEKMNCSWDWPVLPHFPNRVLQGRAACLGHSRFQLKPLSQGVYGLTYVSLGGSSSCRMTGSSEPCPSLSFLNIKQVLCKVYDCLQSITFVIILKMSKF